VELTNKIGQRALTYVASLANQGYELTFEEFEAYVSMPTPTVKSPWGGGDDLEEVFKSEKEPVLDWLVRLGWLARGERTVRITQLGRAVLGAVERHEVAVELPSEVNLGPEERFSYSRLLARMGNLRDAMLVDRYLNHDQLMEILDGSTITRVLIGNDRQLEAERRGLAAALSRSMGLDRPFYIGVSSELRDRFLIPPSGDVSFFGQVISGGGHKGMVVGTIGTPAADSIRRSFEDVWSRATPLAADSLASQGDLVTSGASARPASSSGTSPSARASDEPRLQTASWQSGRSLDTPPTGGNSNSNSARSRDGDDSQRWSVDDARS
jgi:hypothetical protein